MRCVGRVRAFCVTAAVLLCGGLPAVADPNDNNTDEEQSKDSYLSGGAHPEKFLYFSGFDLGAAAVHSTAARNGLREV